MKSGEEDDKEVVKYKVREKIAEFEGGEYQDQSKVLLERSAECAVTLSSSGVFLFTRKYSGWGYALPSENWNRQKWEAKRTGQLQTE